MKTLTQLNSTTLSNDALMAGLRRGRAERSRHLSAMVRGLAHRLFRFQRSAGADSRSVFTQTAACK